MLYRCVQVTPWCFPGGDLCATSLTHGFAIQDDSFEHCEMDSGIWCLVPAYTLNVWLRVYRFYARTGEVWTTCHTEVQKIRM